MTKLSKNIKTSLAALMLCSSLAFANSSYIDYQGVAFNNGAAVASTPISLRFTIYQSNGTTVVYQETQAGVTTTDKGFFSHKIGSGTNTAGAATIDAITWADNYKLQVEVDYANGTTYTSLGIQDISSGVYAKKANSADSLTTTRTIGGVSFNGTANINLPGVNSTGNQNTTGNAATATALATDPSACTAGKYVSDIGANGTLTCAIPTNTTYSAGSAITLSGTSFSHTDTSSQASINNSGATVIQDITLDTYGHITAANSVTVAASNHTHNGADITTGTISDARLPGSISSNITGNAATATQLATARNINGVAFDGTQSITIADSTKLPLTGGIVTGTTYFRGNEAINYNTLSYTAEYDYSSPWNGSGTYGSEFYYYSYNQEGKVHLPYSTNASSATAKANATAVISSIVASYAISAPAFLAFSDKRIKEDITPLENSLEAIMQLNPVTYVKKDRLANGGRVETGFIAQEVKEILPSAVTIGKGDIPVLKTANEMSFEDGVKYKIQITKDGKNTKKDYVGGEDLPEGNIYVISKEVNDFHSIQYDVLYTHAIRAIQEQQKEIKSLKNELSHIKEALKQSGINIK